MNDDFGYDQLRDVVIGTVESVSPREIKVLLEINAPQNTAINNGVPTLFPKINGYILIPNESGALVGMISWMGVEYSQYPKRKGLKDFEVIDLPYPLRKIIINPLGTLKNIKDGYELERGVYSFPSVGDLAVIPSDEQLRSIVENKEQSAVIQIGVAPLASNAAIKVDPDKIFGRHIAVLGNTGSGKSCSVAGLIRWSIEKAKEYKSNKDSDSGSDHRLNARFIILDPNGEYANSFNDLGEPVRKFKVKLDKTTDGYNQLRVPVWLWNSYEWSSVTQASGKTQRPLLRRALREIRRGLHGLNDDEKLRLRRFYSSCLVEIKKDFSIGASAYKGKPGKNDFGKKLHSMARDAENDSAVVSADLTDPLNELAQVLKGIANSKHKTFLNDKKEEIEYYDDFDKSQVENVIKSIERFLTIVGGFQKYEGPDEDSPVPFIDEDLPNHIERLANEQGYQQHLDFLVMRLRTMLSDNRMLSVIGSSPEFGFTDWLESIFGKSKETGSEITVIDLSLVPSDVIHLIIAVISRVIFESLQRYRRIEGKELSTVLVMEEAHTFIKKYADISDEISAEKLCCQSFERIAREGRKFGLGLLLSSQRPSELSPTVLSQCNTFLLHRIVNDRDQELVRRLVPDNLGGLLNELPILPSRKAILLGWASPIPLLVEMNFLEEDQRPRSADPKFWGVWVGDEERNIDWSKIVKDWQNLKDESDSHTSE